MQVRLLGPVDVVVDGQPQLVGGLRRTGMLAVLALAAGEMVTPDQLSEAVWGGGPRPAANTLQSHISALRRVLGRDAITAAPPGYVLDLGTDGTDVQAAERLLRQGTKAADPVRAVADLRTALDLWRGEPLAEVAGLPGLADQAGRLERLQAQIRRALAEARLAAGEHHQLIDELEQMVTADPLDEQLHGQLMLALYRAGRQAHALAAYDRIRQALATDLGIDPSHALRDLHTAILRHDPSLTAPLPAPAAAAPAVPAVPLPAQLPLAVPGFTGRAAELARLDALLPPLPPDDETDTISRVALMAAAVISGTPGVGKTALAVHWAHRITDRFPGGQLYIDLRGFDAAGTAVSPAEALHGFLLALGVPPDRMPADLEARTALYRSRLAGQRVLIVLDNARDPAQVRPLLPGTPGCLAVVTSRQQLASLTVAENACPLTLDLMPAAEARDLLAARLGRQRADAEPGAVGEIITSCARLPLALAIAAARAAARPGFTLAELAAELRDARPALDVLGDDDPATDPRAVFSWSYDALTPQAAGLFRLLSVAPGPDITAPAAASLAAVPLARARRLLAELSTAHLLTEHAPRRYACHDLLRAYTRELAASHDDADQRDAATRRLLDHYLHSVRGAAALLEPFFDPVSVPPAAEGVIADPPDTAERALSWFADERAILLAAVQLAADRGLTTHAWQLAWSLSSFLLRRTLWDDTALACNTALDAARRSADVTGQARCLHRIASFHAMSLRFAEATGLFNEALQLYGRVGDPASQAAIHRTLMWIAARENRHSDALEHSLQAQDLFRAAGNQAGQARVLTDIAYGHAALGRYEQALGYCEQALAQARELGERSWEDLIWDTFGFIYRHLGDYQQSITCYRQALEICQESGDRFNEAACLDVLGDTYREAGADDDARQAWMQALRIFDEVGHPDADELRAKLQLPGARPESSSA
jgi:DNA-binding SARP family transcriptional activator